VAFPPALEIILDYIGKRSFTIYLVHLPMFFLTMEIMFRYTRNHGMTITSDLWPEYTALMFALVLGMTEVIYRLVERPMTERGKRIAGKIMGREAPEGEPGSSSTLAAPAVIVLTPHS